MDSEDRRRQLELQIADLSRTFRATTDEAVANGIKAQMAELRDAVHTINLDAGRALAGKIDEVLRNLEAVRTEHGLDAISALGRSIDRLRQFRNQL